MNLKKLKNKKISRKWAASAGKRFTLFISNEDMNHIINIIRSLEDWDVLIDGVTETVKHEMKKEEGEFLGALLAPLAASIVQPVFSSVVKGISGRGVTGKARRKNTKTFFSSTPSFKQYRDY